MSVPKLVYLLPRMNLDRTPMVGVRKKIVGQVQAFRQLGLDVEIIDTLGATHVEKAAGPKGIGEDKHRDASWLSSLRRKSASARLLLQRVREYGPANLYIRHTITTPGLVLFYLRLRLLPNVWRIYLEVPTWPYSAEAVGYRTDRILSPLIRFLVDRVVTFSDTERIFGVEALRISNGIDIKSLKLLPIPSRAGALFKIVCVAQFHVWSGIDRLIRGIAKYHKVHPGGDGIQVNIAGAGTMYEEWHQLANRLGVDGAVTFHGVCEGRQLEELFDGAHVAVGNLGNHRRRLESNADLKNREYCARGIPFIVSSEDPAFGPDFPFMARVPADESPLDIDYVIEFHDALRADHPSYNQEMRHFAVANLDWHTCMRPVVADMNRNAPID